MKKKISVGDLSHRITFQTVTRTSDGQGGWTETWADFVTAWADIQTQDNVTQSKETIVGKEKIEQRSHKITIRYRSDLKPEMQIKWGTQTLSIRNILDLENDKRFLQLFVDEREV